MRALAHAHVEQALGGLPGWQLEDGRIVRRWSFADFAEAMSFVNRVAALAEEAGHHPDIHIRYNRVTLRLRTHDADGITERDLTMARRLSGEL